MTIIKVIFFTLLFSLTIFANEKNLSEPDYLISEIKKNGAKHVIRKTLKDWDDWEKVLDYMESGTKPWMKVAKLLRQETDAGYSTGLIVTIAYALPNNPENVLPLIDKGFHIDDVCGFPFIEPEYQFIEDHYKNSKKALAKLLNNDLKKIQIECANELDKQYNMITEKGNFNTQ